MGKKKNTEGCCCACPPPTPNLPYDDLTNEVNGNVLSVRVMKKVGKIECVNPTEGPGTPSLVAACQDFKGKRCRPGCAKVTYFPNQAPPPKKPDEETFLLRSKRKLIGDDKMQNEIEIELRTPRNYRPIPEISSTTDSENDSVSKPE